MKNCENSFLRIKIELAGSGNTGGATSSLPIWLIRLTVPPKLQQYLSSTSRDILNKLAWNKHNALNNNYKSLYNKSSQESITPGLSTRMPIGEFSYKKREAMALLYS